MADPISTPALLDGRSFPGGRAMQFALLWTAASLAAVCALYALVLAVSVGSEREAGRIADAARTGAGTLPGLVVALAASHGRPRR